MRTFIRVNERIRAREVRLIDVNGQQVGVVSIAEALRQARQSGLDLVEVAPDAQPPVCRIMDFGKYRYELSKREREARRHQAGSKMKELRFHPNIDNHDFEIKLNHAREFLEKDMRLKCSLKFRGREIMHVEAGDSVMQRLIEGLQDVARVEMPPKLMGRSIVMMLAPLKHSKKTAPQQHQKPLQTAPDAVSHLSVAPQPNGQQSPAGGKPQQQADSEPRQS